MGCGMQVDSKKFVFALDQVEEMVSLHLVPLLKTHRIFAFKGPLGAGKTTLIKEFFKQCGVEKIVTSPTFNYVKHYSASGGKRFHHFDLYRLSSADSFFELGFDEYLYDAGSWTVIEWPEIIEDELARSSGVCFIQLGYLDEDLERRSFDIVCGK